MSGDDLGAVLGASVVPDDGAGEAAAGLRASPCRSGRIAQRFCVLRQQGRAAFVPYLTAGHPSIDATLALCRMLEEEGADVIELGLPFTDPIADGPTNQRAAQRALDAGVRTADVLGVVRQLRSDAFELPLVLFTYWNPLRALLARSGGYAALAGLDGVLVTDLPPEEAADHIAACRSAGIDTIFLVAPTTPDDRLPRVIAATRGFLYVVSSKGVTGARSVLPPELPELLRRVRGASGDLPIAVGFGIANRPTAAAVAEAADGFVVGSALADVVERAMDEGVDVVEAARAFVRAVDPRGPKGPRSARQI